MFIIFHIRSNLVWNELEELLKKYNLKIAESVIINRKQELEEFSKTHKRIVLKLFSPKALHKTEKRLVHVDLTREDAEKIYSELLRLKHEFGGDIVAQEFISGTEVIIGGKKDKQFGYVIMIGSGGIYAELLKDVCFRTLPVNEEDVKAMIEELKLKEIIKGIRGKQNNVDSLIKSVVNSSKMLEKENLKEFDINPFILTEKEGLVVDVRLIKED